MRIDDTKFGSITIDGQVYPHDVYILPSGKIEKRNKKESPRIGGHRALGVREIQYVLSFKPEILLIGKGQTGVLPIQADGEEILNSANIPIIIEKTPELILKFNSMDSQKLKIGAIFHTTC
ncbi:MAG: hypothetical protein EU530_02410 [Promethearchaeota archaeon]|nr:MAG: hypothetical protein EU530_02410 [Candidatus Lokiarchaeota archaeon]